jgi:starch synthase
LEVLNRYLFENNRLFGVLNGLDYSVWNPVSDPRITANFSAGQLDGKRACREALMELVGFSPIEGAPVVGMISRISTQKGFDLLVTAADELFQLPIQLIVQGLGDPQIIDGLMQLEERYPNQFRFLNAFDEQLAQQIYSGCDAFLMPSSFEPCGLGQLIAMRYGTVPIVRATGGLRDTVIEGKNGFSFDNRSRREFIDAVTRAHAAFSTPEWSSILSDGMNGNHDWTSSAKQYIELYEKSVMRRAGHEMTADNAGRVA